MVHRVYNFCSGPAALPLEVLEEAREALLSLGDSGIGILEHSHRGPQYTAVHLEAEANLRRLLGADEESWAVLFLQGGASLQFAMVPMNLGPAGDYVLTGVWSQKALAEAKKLGTPRVAGSSEATGFDRIPDALDLSPDASYVHLTSNNTIYGTQWASLPQTHAPLVIDASSDLLAGPLDLSRCGLIYAGGQKNVGAVGVTLVLIRRELLARSPSTLPTMLRYAVHAEHGSRFNTPPTFSIYVVTLMTRWIERQGGLSAMAALAERKAARLYQAIDASPLYVGHARPEARSRMNVTFRLSDPRLEPELLAEAAGRGLVGLAGHRSVGGLRASIYNAMPLAGVEALAELLEEFARRKG